MCHIGKLFIVKLVLQTDIMRDVYIFCKKNESYILLLVKPIKFQKYLRNSNQILEISSCQKYVCIKKVCDQYTCIVGLIVYYYRYYSICIISYTFLF